MWRSQGGNYKLKTLFTIVPIIILWFLWERSNTLRHGGAYQERKNILEISETIVKFIKVRFKMKITGLRLVIIVDELQSYRVSFSFKMVRWIPSETCWLKRNIDGASKGNLGPRSITFCIRDQNYDIVVAQDSRIKDTTSLVVESITIKECVQHYKINSIRKIILKSASWTLCKFLI